MEKKLYTIFLIIAFLLAAFLNKAFSARAISVADTVKGYILIQTQKNGEAWYVYPKNGQRFFLGRPAQAMLIMKKLSLGAKHNFIINTDIFPVRLSGMILLDAESNGEAYYIYPADLKKYYLGRPDDAFKIMKKLGLGITDNNLTAIPPGDINNFSLTVPAGHFFIASVPFTSQAPTGDWADPRQQNGCEEASALMAVGWARGQNFTADQALAQITGISDWELKNFGEFHDSSAEDTLARIIKGYFNYQNAELKKAATIADMVNELSQGHILIAPMNGQIMGNPHFKAPGPITHMVVITGYDSGKQIFITDDPGTHLGKNYEYDINVFYNAIRDYPTGNHAPIKQIEKNIIIIKK